MVAELKWAGMRWCFASLLSQTLWLVMPTAWAEDKDLATAGVSFAQESLKQCADKAVGRPHPFRHFWRTVRRHRTKRLVRRRLGEPWWPHPQYPMNKRNPCSAAYQRSLTLRGPNSGNIAPALCCSTRAPYGRRAGCLGGRFRDGGRRALI